MSGKPDRKLITEVYDVLRKRPDVINEILEDLKEHEARHTESGAVLTKEKRQFRSEEHEYIASVVNSSFFSSFIMLTILLNGIIIAVETDRTLSTTYPSFFQMVDVVFLTIYAFEFTLKIYDEPKGYWSSAYNRFDFFILFVSFFQFLQAVVPALRALSDITFLRVLRALRALRALRSVSVIRQLQVIVNALLKTFGSFLHLIVLLLLIMYVFAIVGYYFFGFEENGDKERWGSLMKAMWTLFTYVTVDGWTGFQSELDERDYAGSRLYTILFIFIGNFIFTNLFIGVIIQNLEESQEEERGIQSLKKSAMFQKKKQIFRAKQEEDFRALISKDNMEVEENIHEYLEQLSSQLQHDDLIPINTISCNLVWLETFLETLKFQETNLHRSQQLHFEVVNVLAEMLERKNRAATQKVV